MFTQFMKSRPVIITATIFLIFIICMTIRQHNIDKKCSQIEADFNKQEAIMANISSTKEDTFKVTHKQLLFEYNIDSATYERMTTN